MKITTKNLSDTKVQITVSLDKNDLADARQKAIERLAKEVKVEGFRTGKAPAKLAEKVLKENEISSLAIDIAVRTTVPKAFEQATKSPLVIPEVNVTKYVPNESAEYTATADILPDVKLGDYKNLKVKKAKSEATEKEIKEILENIQNAYAEKKTAKKSAENGDEVIIDFVGKKDGKAFEGGTAKDYPLTLGSKSFIPGFEDGIIGHSSGDKFDLELTFPKDYGVKDLAGQKTVFEVLLKQVNEIIKPKLDVELAKKCGNFNSIDELKSDIKKNLEAQNAAKIDEKFKDELVEKLVEKSKVSAPEILIKDQLRLIKDDFTRNAKSRGQELEDYIKSAGETYENWEKEITKIAEKRVKASLVLQILAQQEKITVEEELVDAKIAELRDVYQKSKEALENLKDPRVRMDIKNRLVIEKTLDYLAEINSK